MQHAEKEMENVFRPTGHDLYYNFYICAWSSSTFLALLRAPLLVAVERHNVSDTIAATTSITNERIFRKKETCNIRYYIWLQQAWIFFALPPNFVTICLAKRWAAAFNDYNTYKCFRRNRFQNEKRQNENPIAWQTGQWSVSEMLDKWNIYMYFIQSFVSFYASSSFITRGQYRFLRWRKQNLKQ